MDAWELNVIENPVHQYSVFWNRGSCSGCEKSGKKCFTEKAARKLSSLPGTFTGHNLVDAWKEIYLELHTLMEFHRLGESSLEKECWQSLTFRQLQAQVVETSVTVNGPSQDYPHPDDQIPSRKRRVSFERLGNEYRYEVKCGHNKGVLVALTPTNSFICSSSLQPPSLPVDSVFNMRIRLFYISRLKL